jgi:septal ring factor EnvC (AmiA/AmiB activator)
VGASLVRAQPSDRERTEALAERATARMQALQRESSLLASREKTLLGDLRRLELERQIKGEELRSIDAETVSIEGELASTSARLTALQEDERAARPQLEARLSEMYKLGSARYVRLLLSTANARQIGQAARTVGVLAKLDQDRVVSHQRTVAALTAGRATLEERGQRLRTLHADATRATAAAAKAAQARSDMIQEIDRQRDLNAQLEGELQAAEQSLQLALRSLASDSPSANTLSVLPFKPFKGALDWPVAGTLRRAFVGGAGGVRSATANGIEVAAPDGAPVVAIHEGTVAFADSFTGFGNLVIVDHGTQVFSLYGNLLEVGVAKGARVGAGEMLGTVGASPTGQTGLYFELRIDGQPVDPVQWLKKR